MSRSRNKVIVVGAGLGGLSAAASLASRGFQIEVFEKNDKEGGKLNFLRKSGFHFDLGPSIIILPELFRRLFSDVGCKMEDYFILDPVEPQWRNFFEDGVAFDLGAKTELSKIGAKSEDYWRFVEYSKGLFEYSEKYYLAEGAETLGQLLLKVFMHPVENLGTLRAMVQTMNQAAVRKLPETHLRHVINFFAKYVGSSPYDAPAMMHLLLYSQLKEGLWCVRGGMFNLGRGIRQLAEEMGARFHFGTEVTQILSDHGRVTGVALQGGEKLEADYVVSNMEVIPAYRKLLGMPATRLISYERKFEPSCSGMVIHLGVRGYYPQLAHHNFFFSSDPETHFRQVHREKVIPEDPTVYLVAPTRSDPELAPSGHDIIKILPHIPHLSQEGENPLERGELVALRERVLIKLERMGLTDLRKNIVVENVLTPRDIERLYCSNRGSIYGVVSSLRLNRGIKAPRKSQFFDKLYFVGGSVNPGAGTPMVIWGGQLVARQIAADLTR